MKISTIPQVVEQSAGLYSAKVFLQMKDEEENWQRFTFTEVEEWMKAGACGLLNLGINKGERIGLLSENRPHWGLAYLATTASGAVVVPFEPQIQKEMLIHLLKDCQAQAFFVSQKYLELAQEVLAAVPSLKNIICFDQEKDEGPVLSFSRLKEKGENKGKTFSPVPQETDLASLVYTSGTTGLPKGVPLSHKNIVSNIQAIRQAVEMGEEDSVVSILPLYHTFETTTDFLEPLLFGGMVTYASSLKSTKLVELMQEVKPSIMVGVPLFFQLLYEGVSHQIESSSALTKIIFKLAFRLCHLTQRFTAPALGRRLFGKLHRRLGGRTRFWMSGAAPLDPTLAENYFCLGIPILQGYGLTETAPVLSVGTLKANRAGSVGKPLPGVEIKIHQPNEQGYGEILARGPNVMRGYWNNPEASAKILKDGWFYTGDEGCLDKDNFLYITGRLKDIIVTGSGKNVSPDELETYFKPIPLLKEICVLGLKATEGARKGSEEVVAVVLPDEEFLEKHNLRQLVKKEIDKANQALPAYKKVMRFYLAAEPLPKTPTRKIKRFLVREQLLQGKFD